MSGKGHGNEHDTPTAAKRQEYEGQCRAVTASKKRCRKRAQPGLEPELCDTHRRMRTSRGFQYLAPRSDGCDVSDFAHALIGGWAEAIDREADLRRRSTMPEPRDQDRELDALIDRLERLHDPEARYERGEDSTRAELAALADKHLLSFAQEVRRLRLVLYPRVVA